MDESWPESAVDAEYVVIAGRRSCSKMPDRQCATRMTLRPHAAFALACGSEECATRAFCVLGDLRLVR